MIILGIDPGENIGYAKFDYVLESKISVILESGTQRTEGNNHLAYQFYRTLLMNVDLLVVEDYVINPKVYGHDHQGDKGLTLRQIGALEAMCLEREIEIVKQLPTIKPAGYGFLGKNYQRGKREMHGWDAMAHVEYYLVTQKLKPPLS